MNSEQSFARWMEEVRGSEEDAARTLWDQYFPQLVEVARRKLGALRRPAADEEDVALSALDSFFRASAAGRFPNLHTPGDLWRLLSEMTRRKAVDLIRRHYSLQQGGGHVRGDSAFAGSSDAGAGQMAAGTPAPDVIALLRENFQRFLDALASPELQELALAKMEGHTNSELAARFHCSLSTIELRLRLIRKIGDRTLGESDHE